MAIAMAISCSIAEQMEQASWIRRMFEIGVQLRKERGADNVFDFSLGNPEVEPPAEVLETLRRVVTEQRPHSHGYMPNAGFPEVRARIAAILGMLLIQDLDRAGERIHTSKPAADDRYRIEPRGLPGLAPPRSGRPQE